MSTLTKSSSGLLYEERFGSGISLLWDLVPNQLDRVKINQDSVEILPGDDRIELLMPTPAETGWVYQTHIKYDGRTSTESCGFILKSITDNIAECELRGDTRDMYDYLKVELNSDSILNLKASKNGTMWRDFGNSKMLDGYKFGYYMTALTQYDPLVLYDCVVYRNNFITIDGISKDLTSVVYDAQGANITHRFVITHENGKLILDGSNMLFPIPYLNIKFLDPSFNVIKDVVLKDVYGGDVFDFSFNVTVRIEKQEVLNNTHHLDTVVGPYKLYALSVTNEENYELTNRKLSIQAASSFNPGDLPVTIASTTSHDVVTNLDFKKSLDVSFLPNENKNFFIKIEKTMNMPLLDDEYRFKLTLI